MDDFDWLVGEILISRVDDVTIREDIIHYDHGYLLMDYFVRRTSWIERCKRQLTKDLGGNG